MFAARTPRFPFRQPIPGISPLSLLIASVLAASTVPAAAQAIKLDLPIDCVIGESCMVQNYVDNDPGPGAADFMCGKLTYDGHKGTDFRIPGLAHMRRGVTVRAAAAGKVLGVRNNMPDVGLRKAGKAVKGKECGNGVRIALGGGWFSQYCHMRRGSVRVRPGQRVAAGQALGLVGLSGKTQFPHVHFQLEHKGSIVDPFVGSAGNPDCRSPRTPLWRDARRRGLTYRGTGLVNAGFVDKPPTRGLVDEGESPVSISESAGALVFWVRVFGLHPGDRQRIRVLRPDGGVFVESRPKDVNRHKAQSMSFAGKRPPEGGWPKGVYRGEYSLTRGGKVLVSAKRTVRVR